MQQRLMELEIQMTTFDQDYTEKFAELRHDIKTIKNIVTDLNKCLNKIKLEAVQVKLKLK